MHIAQLMPLPLTVSCFSKIQIGFTFLVPAHLGSPGQSAVERVCVKRISYACPSLVTTPVTGLVNTLQPRSLPPLGTNRPLDTSKAGTKRHTMF